MLELKPKQPPPPKISGKKVEKMFKAQRKETKIQQV